MQDQDMRKRREKNSIENLFRSSDRDDLCIDILYLGRNDDLIEAQ